MNCNDPEKQEVKLDDLCTDCPLDGISALINSQTASEDPVTRTDALSAKRAITEGGMVCDGPSVVSSMGECGISARKICNNPNKQITLSLLNLSGTVRKPA